MRRFLQKSWLLLSLLGAPLLAHDEGHGPKLTDPAKYGGKVAPVILKSDVKKGRKATMHYKAEVTKNSSGTLRIYLYDKDMKILSDMRVSDLGGIVYYRDQISGKGKNVKLNFNQANKEIKTNLPTEVQGRFDFDFTFKTNKGVYFVAFDGMR